MLLTSLMLTVLVTSATADPFDSTFDYCSISCYKSGDRHQLCKPKKETGPNQPTEELSPEDDKKYEDLKDAMSCSGYQSGLQQEEEDFILDLHNKMRSAIATGDLSKFLKNPNRFKQPKAANMVVLKWDEELAAIAQERANDCMSKTDDFCRQTKDGTETGQNTDMNTMGIPEDGQDPRLINLEKAVKKWFEGVMSFKTQWDLKPNPHRSSYELKGMYAQIVWAKTTYVGCGYVDKKDTEHGVYDAFLVCNYKPAGNIGNEEVYEEGSPATACPANFIPTPTYPGVCLDKLDNF